MADPVLAAAFGSASSSAAPPAAVAPTASTKKKKKKSSAQKSREAAAAGSDAATCDIDASDEAVLPILCPDLSLLGIVPKPTRSTVLKAPSLNIQAYRGKNHILVSRRSTRAAVRTRTRKLLVKHRTVHIHGLGAALVPAIQLAAELVKESEGKLISSCSTSTEVLVDHPDDEHFGDPTKLRHNSAIHIQLSPSPDAPPPPEKRKSRSTTSTKADRKRLKSRSRSAGPAGRRG